MQVGRWGNSLAIRLPSAVVEGLGLKEGDDIQIEIASERRFEVSRDQSREDALAQLDALNLQLPPGYVFKRADAYED